MRETARMGILGRGGREKSGNPESHPQKDEVTWMLDQRGET